MAKIIILPSGARVSLERARDEDIDEITAIETRAHALPWTRNVLFTEIHGESFSFVYVARLLDGSGKTGKMLGYHYFWLVADEVHILNITVDPDYQGNGLGKALMRFAIEFGQTRGATCVLLEVRESNTRAYQLYRNLGFEHIGLRRAYYSDNKEDAYVMKLAIEEE